MTSSLIFVVLFGVWAAYMLQHWVRRREDLATADSVDRFSEAMHMLERRAPQQAEDELEHGTILRPSSARVVRQDVTYTEVDEVSVQAFEDVVPAANKGATALGAVADRVKNVSAPARSTSPQVKAGALLGALAFFAVTLGLAVFSVVPFWMPVVGIIAVGGVFVWLRRSATQQAHVEVMARPVVASTPAQKRSPRVVSQQLKAATTSSEPVPADYRVESVVPHVEVIEEPVSVVSVRDAEAEVFDQGWSPVAVPKPTYTMKAKAERDEVFPAATVDSRPLAARYENASIDELPFDGMALDEDYEELPRVYRAS